MPTVEKEVVMYNRIDAPLEQLYELNLTKCVPSVGEKPEGLAEIVTKRISGSVPGSFVICFAHPAGIVPPLNPCVRICQLTAVMLNIITKM